MSKRRTIAQVGSESARQRLPQLLERARRGAPTIITRRGEPCAVLTPFDARTLDPAPVSFSSLRGSGKGLWGNVARHVDVLRREW